MSDGPGLFEELKRRNVFRVAAMYAVVGWLLIQIGEATFDALGLPAGSLRLLIIAVAAGFPVALVLGWVFDWTSEGLVRTSDDPQAEVVRLRTGRRVDYTIIGVLALALCMSVFGPELETPGGAELEPERKPPTSLVVLPFDDLSPDGDQEYFAHGISEELINVLTGIPDLDVKGRTTGAVAKAMGLDVPQIGEQVGVEAVIEGSVRKAGRNLRVSIQMIAVDDGFPLWSETYDRELSAANIFAIQSDIASAVAGALRTTLSQDDHRRLVRVSTQNLAAIDSYFLGKQLLERRTRESLFAAVEYFRQVIELDPDFALAYSGLADAYMLLPEYVPEIDPPLTLERSEAAAERALALAPDLPEALTSMAWNRLIHYYDWEGAETFLRRALAVEGDSTGALHWLSHVLSWQGRHEEAIERARQALDVDPLSRLMTMNLSYILADAGEFEAAIDLAQNNLRRYPDHVEQHGNLWRTFLRADRPEDASETMQRWAALTGRDVEAARAVGDAFVRYARTGERQSLSRELVGRAAFGSADLGWVYASVGDGERALAALEQAYEERSGSRSVLSMKLNRAYDFIRDDSRFQEILEETGLAD